MKKSSGSDFRNSDYFDILQRNSPYPSIVKCIKEKVKFTFAILACGLGYTQFSEFCDYSNIKILSESSYNDYLRIIEPVLRNLAERICNEKLIEALQKGELKVGFDAGWSHRRNANQCIGTLIDLITGYLLTFQIVHHGNECNLTLTPTEKASKSMEKISLTTILDRINITNLKSVVIVHDCDIQADSLIKKHWSEAIIKYDPNHFCSTQLRLIDELCNDKHLKGIKERLKKFYSSLLHNRTLDLEEKISQWKNSLNHYIQTENWTSENNAETINALETVIKTLMSSFSKVDPNLSTNINESFNNARATIANKRIGWRRSWRIRSYISIIRWNDPHWVSTIYNEFKIDEQCQTMGERRRMERETLRLLERTESYKKKRAVYKKSVKNKFKTKKNEKNLHEYKVCTKPAVKKTKRKTALSHNQKIVIESIFSQATEDKKYVSMSKILTYIIKYESSNESDFKKSKYKSQITRLVNNGILKKKKMSYKLKISNDQVKEILGCVK